MSSSNSASGTSVADAVATVYWNLKIITLIWGFSLIPLGTIGHTLNIYVFTRRTFRSNPCTKYFLASTISGYQVIYISIPVRLLQSGYGIDLTIYSLASCKIIVYLLVSTKALSPWFMACACVDRFFSSSQSAAFRKWSNVRITRRVISLVVLVVYLAYSHMPYFYTLDAQHTTCTGQSSLYRQLYSICSFFVLCIIPSFAMLFFGLLTVRHKRQARARIAPDNTQARFENLNKAIERQMIRMTIVQTFVYCATTIPFAAVSLYLAVTANWTKGVLQKANENFLFNLTGYISLLAPVLSFYIFTLASQPFRRELIRLFHCWRHTEDHREIHLETIWQGNTN